MKFKLELDLKQALLVQDALVDLHRVTFFSVTAKAATPKERSEARVRLAEIERLMKVMNLDVPVHRAPKPEVQ